jgi:hypothetical protein
MFHPYQRSVTRSRLPHKHEADENDQLLRVPTTARALPYINLSKHMPSAQKSSRPPESASTNNIRTSGGLAGCTPAHNAVSVKIQSDGDFTTALRSGLNKTFLESNPSRHRCFRKLKSSITKSDTAGLMDATYSNTRTKTADHPHLIPPLRTPRDVHSAPDQSPDKSNTVRSRLIQPHNVVPRPFPAAKAFPYAVRSYHINLYNILTHA